MVEVEEVQEDERHFRTTVHVVGTLAAEEAASEAQLLVRQSRSVCDRCSRIAGGYYAAIIQLRATERDVTERELSKAHDILSHELDHAQASGNRFAFLAKSGPQHGGYDYFIGDIDAARNATRVMAHRLGAEVQESAKLVGRRDGRDLYRVTMLVRIRLLAPGDFVLADERPYEVVSVDRGKVTCYDLHRGQRTRIPEKGLRRLGGPEILEEAVVVSHEGDTLQVLDPVTLRTRDVALRGEVIPEGTAMVLRLEEELVLPHAREASIVKYGES